MYDRPNFRPDPSLEELIRRASNAPASSSPPQFVSHPPSGRRGNGIAWLIAVVSIFIAIGAVIFATSVRTTTQSNPTNTTTAPPSSYPSLASTYQGSVHNSCCGDATLTLTSIVQNQQEISGNVVIGPGLSGSGPFTGTIMSDGSVSFTDTPTDGASTIFFIGTLNADGSFGEHIQYQT